MADVKIQTAGELQEAVQKSLEAVRIASITALETAVDKTSKETLKETRQKSPKRTGVYAKSWTSRKTSERIGAYGREIYQKKKPGLPHLLQDGHEITGAEFFRKNRTRTRAFPHIPPDAEVEKAFTENLLAEIDKEMGKT